MDKWFWILVICVWVGCARSTSRYIYESPDLKIEQISEHTYRHISYLNYNRNKVGCNGVFAVFGKEVIIIDSPTDDRATNLLLDHITEEYRPSRMVAIPNHFHIDCTGGLRTMLDRGVVVYGYAKTIAAMENQDLAAELKSFDTHLDMELGNGKGVILNRYFGAAHTRDNIATYILPDSVLFGGCMVKSLDAGRGNLADADTLQWSTTIINIKKDIMGQAKVVVPGHGTPGGAELLDYTIEMFDTKK